MYLVWTLESLWNRRNFFLDNKIKFWKMHWFQIFGARIFNFWIFDVIIVTWMPGPNQNFGSWIINQRFFRARDSRAYDHQVINPKSSKLYHKSCDQCNFQNLILLSRKKFSRFLISKNLHYLYLYRKVTYFLRHVGILLKVVINRILVFYHHQASVLFVE